MPSNTRATAEHDRLAEPSQAGGGMEFELLDSGVFDEDRYFDVHGDNGRSRWKSPGRLDRPGRELIDEWRR